MFSKRNGQGWFGEKQTKWRTTESDEMSLISSAEISNLEVDRDFSR